MNEHERQLTASISKSTAVMCVRNTMLEDIHAGIEPVTRAGDFTDVVVIDADGRRIPWPEVSRIGNDEMGRLMRQVVNRLYTFQAKADDPHFVRMMDRALAEAMRWDEPELDEIILSAIASSRPARGGRGLRMRAASHEWGNGTGAPLPHRGQPMPPYRTALRAAAGAVQLPTAAVNGWNSDATGTLSPRHSRPRLGRARGWQETSGLRALADSSWRPIPKKRRTSRSCRASLWLAPRRARRCSSVVLVMTALSVAALGRGARHYGDRLARAPAPRPAGTDLGLLEEIDGSARPRQRDVAQANSLAYAGAGRAWRAL